MTALDVEPEASGLGVERRSKAPLYGLLICFLGVLAGTIASMFISRRAYDPNHPGAWPFLVLALGVGVVITLITLVRLHAFLALIFAAMAAGLMAHAGALPQADASRVQPHLINAMSLTAVEFGKACGGIGIVIVFAAVIGMCLLESGAADRVVRSFLAGFGEKRAGLALLLSTYIVSIPIFFDTIFMLLIPLARALRLRTGKDYLLYVLAICCAGVITHSMAIPHPGPLAMLDRLRSGSLYVDPGVSIFAGLTIGIIPMFAGWAYCHWINRRMPLPLTEAPGANLDDLRAIMDRPTSALPSFTMSILPVILPVIMIWVGSLTAALFPGRGFTGFFAFMGERHVALLVGTVLAVAVLMKQRGLSFAKIADLIGPPLETAGVIILITAAGGAFGAMLRNAGVGNAIKAASEGYAINLIVLGYVVAAVIRVAQGSATVAMLTTAPMIAPMMGDSLPYHPVYLFLAIGFGAMFCSWMNDSGFWVVSRLGGLTERQTLRSWTVMLTVISLAGFSTTLLMSMVLPMAMK